jgi:hypothetical protein
MAFMRLRQPVEAPDLPAPFGAPLRLCGLERPFALCTFIAPGGRDAGLVIVDLRDFRLMAVSDAYVNVVRMAPTDDAHATAECASRVDMGSDDSST